MATKKLDKPADLVTCKYCGKRITAESALEHEAGSYCHSLREAGWTDERLQEHRRSMSADEVPVTEDGRPYLKVAVLGKILRKEGIPVARLVRAFGGDRAIDPPLHEKFTPTYVGKARYVHPDCGETWGLNFLRKLPGRSSNNKTAKLAKALKK